MIGNTDDLGAVTQAVVSGDGPARCGSDHPQCDSGKQPELPIGRHFLVALGTLVEKSPHNQMLRWR